MRVAIIGAGAAGLCAARHAVARNMQPIVYEQTSAVGGVWMYTEETEFDKNGLKIHSAMYKNLKTNLPKQVMEFPDFPFPDELPSFMTHGQVQRYLESYCDHFDLRKYIQFETYVSCVKPVVSDEGRWEVTRKDYRAQAQTTSIFDAVFVCNGHYAMPHCPKIQGHEHFQGITMHSHAYRHPEIFVGKTVVVLGARSSGQDISLDIATQAKKVIISHRTPRVTCKLPSNVSQAPPITRFGEDGKTVVFEDETKTELDAFLLCTGYEYNFPFLHPSCNITIEDGRVKHLYNHLICATHPSLIFIGICSRIAPCPQFHYQVLYGLGVLTGTISLPTEKEMVAELEENYRRMLENGKPQRATHAMEGEQWGYNDLLADAAKLPRLNPRVMELYKAVGVQRRQRLCEYKQQEINVLSNGFYKISP